MAFNPFSAFRKYQKYWMACAVLVCMLTFVLCSGGGKGTGLDDWLLPLIGRHRDTFVKINGTSYNSTEISDLKIQRNIANEFMRELLALSIKNLKEMIKQETAQGVDKKDPQAESRRMLQTACLKDLYDKLHRQPRYFRGGNRLDDLIEFILWRDLANKYDVNSNNVVLENFVETSCHGKIWGFNADASRMVMDNVRRQHYTANDATVKEALKQEYLVQTVQLAALARWSPANGRDDLAKNIGILLNNPMQFRIAPTPEQIASDYKKKRTELTISLLPVSLEVLAKKEKLDPDPDKKMAILKEFYEKYADKPYDPTKDAPGFMMKSQAKIQFFAADASMEYYKRPAHALNQLEQMPPVAFIPLAPPLANLTYVLSGPPAWQTSLERNLGKIDKDRERYKQDVHNRHGILALYNEKYLSETKEKDKADAKLVYDEALKRTVAPHKYTASSWTTPYYYSPGQYNAALEKPTAAAVGGLLGGLNVGPFAGLASYQDAAYKAQADKVAPMQAVDARKRIEAGVTLELARIPDLLGGGNPFAAAGLSYYADLQPQFLPVAGFIEKELRAKIEENQAERWVNAVMLDVKNQLEAVKSHDDTFRERVKDLQKQYSTTVTSKDGTKRTIHGLIFGKTAEPRNEYDIEVDEALKPLRDSFYKYRSDVNIMEGRGGKAELLREWDFHKLFFGSEHLGVGQLEPFVPKIWPPYATTPKSKQDPLKQDQSEIRLFDTAALPVIFWKSDKLAPQTKPFSRNDTALIEFIEHQYRLDKARALFQEELKKIADEVKKAQHVTGKELTAVMRDEAQKHGTAVLTLNRVAALVENPEKGADQPAFVEYALPVTEPNRIAFPRSDMVKSLLALKSLSAPLSFGTKEVDDLNKSLFWNDLAPSSKVSQVQIIPNKSHTVYYLATVTETKPPETFSFFAAMAAGLGRDGFQSKFAEQLQEDYAKELLQLFVLQMRVPADVFISKEAEKQFADEPLEK